MKYKKKPSFFYIMIMIVSIVSGIVFIFLYKNIKVLETTVQSARMIRLFRDISRFHFWVLFLTCIPVLIRGLGFDIKKFNFNKELQELKLEAKDNEEVEVSVELNTDTVKRIGRKLGREFKYYYLENKFFINVILGVVAVILILVFPFNRFVVNRDLNEGELLGTNNFNIRINDSYISDRNKVSENNSYVILNISVIGKTNKYKIDLDEFILSSKNNKYIPSLKYYYYFTDIGKGYRNNILNTSDYEDYILVYNISSKDKESSLIFTYLGNDRNIKIKPSILD